MKWLVALVLLTAPALAEGNVIGAEFTEPVTRYGHDALGPGHEWGALTLVIDTCPACALLRKGQFTLRLPEDLVFEDIAPREVDLDRDGKVEFLVIESSLSRGSRLALWDGTGRIAAAPFIGRSFRWLAPIGVGDFNGDGLTEIAWIETPHLGKVLKIARREGDRLVVIAEKNGLTNHHFGSAVIESAVLDCGGHAVIVTADADWRQVMVTRFDKGKLVSRALKPYAGPEDFRNLPDCN